MPERRHGPSDSSRRGFLGAALGLVAGAAALAAAVPALLVPPVSSVARRAVVLVSRGPLRLRVRPLRRESLYDDHDLAG